MVLAMCSGMTPRLLLLLPSLSLASCGLFEQEHIDCGAVDCAPCASPVTVRLQVPAGQPPPEATLQGLPGSCSVDAWENRTVCSLSANRPGTYEFDIQATGYQKAHVRETVIEADDSDGCCHCSYVGRVVEVQLTPQ